MVRTKEVARMSTGGCSPRKDTRQPDTEGQAVRKSTPPSWATPTTISRGVKKPKPKPKSKPKPKPKAQQKPKSQRYHPGTVALRGRGSIANEAVYNYQVLGDSDDDDQSSYALGSGLASPQVILTGSGTPQSHPFTAQLAPQSQEGNSVADTMTHLQSYDVGDKESHVTDPRSDNLSLLTLAAEQMQLRGGCPAGSTVQATVEDATGSPSHKVIEDTNLQREEGENTTKYVSGDKNLHDAAHQEVEEIHGIPVNVVPASVHVNNEGRGATHNEFESSSCATSSLNLTGMADLIDDNDTSEFDSIEWDGRVPVNEYRVKLQNAELLRAIFSRYGDIGANCALRSVAARSFFMDLVCETLQELMAIDFTKITKNKILRLNACLGDVEKEKIEVGWLKTRLDEILEAKEAIPLLKPSSDLRQLRAERGTKIQTLREQLTVDERDLNIKMDEIHVLQQKVNAALQNLSQAEDEARKIDLTISECKAKLGHLTKLQTLASGLV